MYSVLWFVQ